MNNKGQTLVLFIILIPVFLIIFAFAIDTSYMSIKEKELEDVANVAIEEINKTGDINKANEYIKKVDKNIKIISIRNDKVVLEKDINPIFGQIIGFNNYKIKANIER